MTHRTLLSARWVIGHEDGVHVVHDDVRHVLADREAVAVEREDRLYEYIPQLDRTAVAPDGDRWTTRPDSGGPDPLVYATNVFQFHGFSRT